MSMKRPEVAALGDATYMWNRHDRKSRYLHLLNRLSDHTTGSFDSFFDPRAIVDEAQYWLSGTLLRNLYSAVLLTENSNSTVARMYASCERVQRRFF